MADHPVPLSNEEVADLDAAYRPIPTFKEFSTGAKVEPALAWERAAAEFMTLRTQAPHEAVLQRSINVAMRAAAFDTGAIEGLYETTRGITITVAQQAHMWEQQVADLGEKARPLFEAQLRAYEVVLDLATRQAPVTEIAIRQLHELLTGPQETYPVRTPVGVQERPLPRGQYKTDPNHVELPDGTTHSYAPVDDVGPEMSRLVEELRGKKFADAHPAMQAAYSHWALASIHPFADGNGRVARALASIYTYRAASVPVLILADERDRYFDALAAADAGDYTPVVTLMARAGISAMQLVSETFRTALVPSPEDGLAQYRRLSTAQGGLTHQDLDAVAGRVLDEVIRIREEYLGGLSLPQGFEVPRGLGHGSPTEQGVAVPEGYRDVVQSPRYTNLTLLSHAPAEAQWTGVMGVFVDVTGSEDSTFRVVWSGTQEPVELTLALWEVQPDFSLAAENRVRSMIERVVGSELNRLLAVAAASLRNRGYDPPPAAA